MLRGSCLALLISACTSGAPPGFSGGSDNQWSMPLVGPLENGPLVTAVTINTNGPYLFLVDPDAPISVIDGELVKKHDFRSFAGPKRLDESDTQQVRSYAELLNLEIGTLIVERRDAVIVRPGTFDSNGRRIMGVLGHDVFADSLAWGFDRDNGIVTMVTQKTFKPPPESTAISYGELNSRVANAQSTPPPRRLVDFMINDQKFAMHVDLGSAPSQLREELWDKAKLTAREVKTAVVDEIGSFRPVTKASEPAKVTRDAISVENVVFIPYGDKRWDSEDIAGSIGLGFFATQDVWQSWHTKQYFLVPRVAVPAATRIGRWDSPVFAKCKNPGCVTIRVTDPLAGKPVEEGKPHPGLVMSITREEVAGGMGLEVMIEATNIPELPRLLVNMAGNVDKMLHQLPATYLNATLNVVDASPFPRTCPGAGGCIDQLAR